MYLKAWPKWGSQPLGWPSSVLFFFRHGSNEGSAEVTIATANLALFPAWQDPLGYSLAAKRAISVAASITSWLLPSFEPCPFSCGNYAELPCQCQEIADLPILPLEMAVPTPYNGGQLTRFKGVCNDKTAFGNP
jgi:hypothetical protein